MPIGKRLNVVTWSGPDVEFAISDDNFRSLEGVFGRKLDSAHRDRLHFLCSQYLHWKRIEGVAQTYSDLDRLFENAAEAIKSFQALAFGELTPMTDAGGELDGLLEAHLGNRPISIPRHCLEIYDEEQGKFEEVDLDGPPIQLRLTSALLEELGYSLGATKHAMEKEIAGHKADKSRPGFTPGQAFNEWLRAMHVWAQDNGFPFGPYVNNWTKKLRGPTTFSLMLFELNKLFPDGYREVVSSPMAVADRLKRALKRRR